MLHGAADRIDRARTRRGHGGANIAARDRAGRAPHAQAQPADDIGRADGARPVRHGRTRHHDGRRLADARRCDAGGASRWPVGSGSRCAVFLSAARLVGLDPIETTRLLGRPVETAEAPPALRWSWRAERCTLQLFFFMDLRTRDFRALSFQTSGYDDANDADLRCLADVVAQAGSDERR
jgi:hypothetical protein